MTTGMNHFNKKLADHTATMVQALENGLVKLQDLLDQRQSFRDQLSTVKKQIRHFDSEIERREQEISIQKENHLKKLAQGENPEGFLGLHKKKEEIEEIKEWREELEDLPLRLRDTLEKLEREIAKKWDGVINAAMEPQKQELQSLISEAETLTKAAENAAREVQDKYGLMPNRIEIPLRVPFSDELQKKLLPRDC